MRICLERVRVINWRGITDGELTPGPTHVTWLVGRNGSGKSSMLDAIAFLADFVRVAGKARQANLRGAPDDPGLVPFSDLLANPDQPTTFELELLEGDEGRRWRYELTLGARGEYAEVLREWLSVAHPDGWRSVLERDASGARWLCGGTTRGQGTWEPALTVAGTSMLATATDHQPTTRWMAEALRGVWLLRLDPLLMRGGPRATWKPGTGIERHGRDLISWAAQRLQSDPELTALMETTAAHAGLPVLRVDDDGRLRWMSPEGDRPMWTASDGQIVQFALTLLVVLLPEEITVLLLDEPAAAVDRMGANDQAASVYEIGDRVQVLAATQLLEAVDSVSKREVVLVERVPGKGAIFTPLLKAPAMELEAAGGYRPGSLAWAWWEHTRG